LVISAIQAVDVLLLATGALASAGLLAIVISTLIEGERIPFRRALLAAVVLPLPLLLLGLLDFPGQRTAGWAVFGLFWGSLAVVVLPVRIAPVPPDGEPKNRFDERDTIFSRADLQSGTKRFQQYYQRRPQNLEADERFRAEPGLLSTGSREADRLAFAAVEAGFFTEEHLRFITDGEISPERVRLEPERITEHIRELGRYLGGLGVSFRAIYIYGSAMTESSSPCSDIDIIVVVDQRRDEVNRLLRGLDLALVSHLRSLSPQSSRMASLLDVRVVEQGQSPVDPSVIGPFTRPVCLWRGTSLKHAESSCVAALPRSIRTTRR